MTRDDRLEIDADGRLVDGGVLVDLEVVADRADEGAIGAALALARRHSWASAVIAALAVAALVTGLVRAAQPPGLDPVVIARVDPLGFEARTLTQDAEGLPLVASYAVTPLDGGAVEVIGLDGPYVRASTAYPASDGRVRVAALPDCLDPASLDPPGGGYRLRVLRTDSAGRVVEALLRVPPARADWGSVIRRTCWSTAAAAGLRMTGVATRPDPQGRWLVLDVGLQNGTGRDVQVRGLDVANVDAVEDAVAVVLPAGSRRSVPVRLPVPACGEPDPEGYGPGPSRPPGSVSFAVGPPTSSPQATVDLALGTTSVAAVAQAFRDFCGPAPDVEVEATAVQAAPTSGVLTDTTAVALDLRLRVRSDADEVVLGDAVTALTADARQPFGVAVVREPGQGRTVVLRWYAACGSGARAVLPVSVTVDGRRWLLWLDLGSALLDDARAVACRPA